MAKVTGGAVTAGTAVSVARQTLPVLRQPSMPVRMDQIEGDLYQGEPTSGRYTKDGKLIRRMNPLNIRALRKAIRRVGSAERLFKSVFTISGGQVRPKTRRRRS